MANPEMVNVRYMVDDVDDAIAFYTTFLFRRHRRGIETTDHTTDIRPLPHRRAPRPRLVEARSA